MPGTVLGKYRSLVLFRIFWNFKIIHLFPNVVPKLRKHNITSLCRRLDVNDDGDDDDEDDDDDGDGDDDDDDDGCDDECDDDDDDDDDGFLK